jgi:hypothetical protein
MGDGSTADGVRARLQGALGQAMKARDKTAIAAFRSALAAIDNAEAADLSDAPPMQPGAIAGGVAGLGAGEVPRRALAHTQLADIALALVGEWRSTAADYERSGHPVHAARLEAEAAILCGWLATQDT